MTITYNNDYKRGTCKILFLSEYIYIYIQMVLHLYKIIMKLDNNMISIQSETLNMI